MRRKRPLISWLLILLSLFLAAMTTLVLRGHLARLEARAAAAGPGEPVVTATSSLERGTVLEPEMLAVDRVPDRYRPPGSLRGPSGVVGRTLAADVAAGEAITAVRLAPPGGPVAGLVPQGLRAVPVAAAIPRAVVAAGDRVDVLATYATGQPHTETVVADAEVLLVVPAAAPDMAGATTLILMVGPEDAERLAYARAFADIAVAIVPSSST